MTIATTVIAVLVGLLSLAAGAAKVALVPEEAEFLRQFGFSDVLTMGFGAGQVLGGLMLLVPATRLYGAAIAALGFALSVVLILTTGNLVFAAVSAVPLALACFVAYRSLAQPVAAKPDP